MTPLTEAEVTFVKLLTTGPTRVLLARGELPEDAFNVWAPAVVALSKSTVYLFVYPQDRHTNPNVLNVGAVEGTPEFDGRPGIVLTIPKHARSTTRGEYVVSKSYVILREVRKP